jgi:hypothetical protein
VGDRPGLLPQWMAGIDRILNKRGAIFAQTPLIGRSGQSTHHRTCKY